MFPPEARTLSGGEALPQHLVELDVGSSGLKLSIPSRASHLLLLSLRGRIACFQRGLAWHLEPAHHSWLTPHDSLTLRGASFGACEALAWRFEPGCLPTDLQALLPAPRPGPVMPPGALTPSMQTLLLALRGCPVAPSLRSLWGTGKLIELLTLLLPPPPDSPRIASSRILHPAIRAALAFMNAHLADPIGLPEMAAAVHSSPSHLSRLFTAEFGHGPTIHLRRLRLDHAAALLRSGRANVTEASFACGYQSLGQFSRAFAEHHGHPPSTLLPRNNG